MLRLALLSARGRLGTFAGAFVALAASSALVVAGGMPFEAALRTQPPVERYGAAAAVVTGQQVIGADHDVPLGERARVPSALTARLAAVPGVRAAIPDVSVPAPVGGRPTAPRGAGGRPARRPPDGRPRMEQRCPPPLRAAIRPRPRPPRRGRDGLSRAA